MNGKSPENARPFDVVVWGATGFTGRLVADYLSQQYPPGSGLRWAVAGRDRGRLQAIVDTLPHGSALQVIIADSNDAESLTALASRTRVVLTTVGPYSRYGTPLVEACVRTGTHYCDLSGEPHWMRQMIDRYHPDAQSSGARIVHSCGFDSIPSDFGVWFLQREARHEYGRPCRRIRLLVRAMRGGASGGTIASMTATMDAAKADRDVARTLVDPYGLNPEGERDGPDVRDQIGTRYDEVAGTWTAPFIMATINTKVVRRTNALLGYPYGRDFRYSEVVMTGPGAGGWGRAQAISLRLDAFMLANSIPLCRSLIVSRLVPKPGEGPSRKQREAGFFKLLLIGSLDDGAQLRARVTGDRDPGYGSTSKMLSESAVCLAKDDLDIGGGFWTPASALGEHLFARLTSKAGLTFERL